MATDRQRQYGFIISCGVLTALSSVIVFLRILVRGYIVRNIGWDDWTIIAATVFTIGYFAALIACKNNKIGFPMTELSLNNMENIFKLYLSIGVSYCTAVFFVKVSILFLYLRFAVTRTLKLLCIYGIVFHFVFLVICIVFTFQQCRPLKKMWDFTGTVQGKCFNNTAFFYSTSAINIVTDIWILALPMKTLYRIKRPRSEKFALLGIFGVGAFACIISIVRLHSIYTYTLAEDPFKSGLKVNLWSMIEVNVAILCASVPALKPLLTPNKPMTAQSTVTSSQGTGLSVMAWLSALSKPR